MSSETSNPTLYDRLGGVYSIAAVVDDFIDRVMHNPILNANPAVDEAHHRVSAAGFKYYVTEMVCWAAGGPQKYTGRRRGPNNTPNSSTAVREVESLSVSVPVSICPMPLDARPWSILA
jgi:truncated hemoglobin YjbI